MPRADAHLSPSRNSRRSPRKTTLLHWFHKSGRSTTSPVRMVSRFRRLSLLPQPQLSYLGILRPANSTQRDPILDSTNDQTISARRSIVDSYDAHVHKAYHIWTFDNNRNGRLCFTDHDTTSLIIGSTGNIPAQRDRACRQSSTAASLRPTVGRSLLVSEPAEIASNHVCGKLL